MSKKNMNNIRRESKLPAGNMRTTPTDYPIPRFGFKSALVIILAATLSTIVVPLVFSIIGLPFKMVVILANTFITSYAVAYSRYFIETKLGYCKRFWITYSIFAFFCFFIGFFWVSMRIYL